MLSPQILTTQDILPNDVSDDIKVASSLLAEVKAEITRVFIGRPEAIDLALTAVLACGHVLIEDAPGSGKTALSRTLATCLGLDFQRVQCTNDLLPADITGMSVFDSTSGSFTFRQGPVFTQMLLADELNRAPSRTQSSLLEAMEEKRVTIDRDTIALPLPFLVVATQNPRESIGTFDLPESQLDRFAISMAIGRPEKAIQRRILAGMAAGNSAEDVKVMANSDKVLSLQKQAAATTVHDDILDYIIDLADVVEAEGYAGLSVRYRNQLTRLSQAFALLAGRDFVAPDDVQAMLYPSLRHRMSRIDPSQRHANIKQVIAEVPLP
jgi:MoxR-like ATPase